MMFTLQEYADRVLTPSVLALYGLPDDEKGRAVLGALDELMTEHTSDCALHNAPAEAPGNCSCGASRLFRIYRYDTNNDTYRWVTFSREALIAEVVGSALARCYGQQKVVRISTLIERAIRFGLTEAERNAVADAWSAVRTQSAEENLRRWGHQSIWSDLDGRYLQLEDMPGLLTKPEDDDLVGVMAPWFEYWRTLPEPMGERLSFAA